MYILIVSGFLGAGKTTFIKEIVRRTGKEIAILENEYGSVGVDKDKFISDSINVGEINIWELTEGCICCSSKESLALSVLTIANSVDPEILVIEPTGVAKLSNLIENLKQIEYDRIKFLAPVTIVDGKNYEINKRLYEEIFKDQIKHGRSVIITKLEGESQQDKNNVREYFEKLVESEEKHVVVDPYGQEPDFWDDIIRRNIDGDILIEKSETNEENLPETLSLTNFHVESPEKIILLLEDISRGKYGEIIRAKGSFRSENMSFLFDLSHKVYSVVGVESDEDDKAVFIGKNISRQSIRKFLYGNDKVMNRNRIMNRNSLFKNLNMDSF